MWDPLINLTMKTKVVFVFSDAKGLQSADHICKRLHEKRWTKCLRGVIKKVFIFFLFSSPKPLSLEHFIFTYAITQIQTPSILLLFLD
ncbi:hypothetical protein HanRHA438_Chr05g0216761 [Helianthus annuus]|nr:hypothetical protein HanRHA438_Chr05g0216761 [Helianthus annuus]